MTEGRILVIDDSEIVLAKAKSILTEAGYEVQTTTQTVGAARFLRWADLVLLDFHMPGIDGSSVLVSMQGAASSAGSKCAFYLYTSDAELAIRYASFGFDGAVRHKGDHAALVMQVRAALRMKKMRDLTRKKKPDSAGSPFASEPRSGGSVPPPAPIAFSEMRTGGTIPPPPITFSEMRTAGTIPPPPPITFSEMRTGGTIPPPPPSSKPVSTPPARRTAFPPPPRPAKITSQEEEDDELTADFPRTPA